MANILLSTLTGEPEISGTKFGFAEFKTPVSGVADQSESLTKQLNSGTIKMIELRRRYRWSLGYRDLTAAQYLTLTGILSSPVGFTFKPRTVGVKDAAGPEPVYTVRLLTMVPVTRPLYLGGSLVSASPSLANRFDIDLELETTSWLT